MIDNQQVGRVIASLRREKGLSQQELAQVCSVTHQAVSKWEKGLALPDMQTMLFLSKFFGRSMEEMLTVTVEEAPPREEVSVRQEEDDGPGGDTSCLDWPQVMSVLPFASEEQAEALFLRALRNGGPDVGMLVAMAPFVPSRALDRAAAGLPVEALAVLAPFLSSDAVDGMVCDGLENANGRPGEKRFHKGADPAGQDREERLEMRIARQAVADGNEEWLEEHGEDLTEEELREICLLAAEEELWGALEHLTEHADERTLDQLAQRAADKGAWSEAEEWAEHMSREACGALLKKAAQQERWDTASTLLPLADAQSCRAFLEEAARRRQWGEVQEAMAFVPREDVRRILEEAVSRSDWQMIRVLSGQR